jgi:hypothetical protein
MRVSHLVWVVPLIKQSTFGNRNQHVFKAVAMPQFQLGVLGRVPVDVHRIQYIFNTYRLVKLRANSPHPQQKIAPRFIPLPRAAFTMLHTTGARNSMQRQDAFQIDRSNILLFIAQLMVLANSAIRIAASARRVDGRLLHSFIRSETAMLIVLGGILGNTNTRGLTPGLDDEVLFDEPDDRHLELLRIAATFRQIATSLALILSMFPRAFRDRHRSTSLWGGHSLSPLRGGAAEPGVQGWDGDSLTPGPMAQIMSSILHHAISGLRIPLRGSAMAACSAARAPP